MILALDTEDTGLDMFHGCKPFFVTICDEEGNQYGPEAGRPGWEWPVNPMTRQPEVPESDLDEIEKLLASADEIVFHNCKFDIRALATVRPEIRRQWRWGDTHDTLIAAHLLASNQSHDLTSLALQYLGVDILPYEERLKAAVQEARRVARRDYPEWAIAEEGNPDLPSAQGKLGTWDYWLPKAVWDAGYTSEPSWETVLSEYANQDSAVTIALWSVLRAEIERRKHWAIYEHRRTVPRALYEMEERGVTMYRGHLSSLKHEYLQQSAEADRECVEIAKGYGYDLDLPKSGNNGSLLGFCFDQEQEVQGVKAKAKAAGLKPRSPIEEVEKKLYEDGWRPETGYNVEDTLWSRTVPGPLALPIIDRSEKTGKPSLDKDALETYETTLDGEQLRFVHTLKRKRKRDTAITYLEAYERFWLPVNGSPGWRILHPSVNQTGTDTLRLSSSRPNAQNISKQESKCPHCRGEGCLKCNGTGEDLHSLRFCFGPMPGREWWSLDYENIELRIPGYRSGEQKMIDLFERSDSPPFFGSYHLLNASIVYPDLFWPLAEKKGAFKQKYGAEEYQYGKNGGFCKQYGGGWAKTDATFRRHGAYDAINTAMPAMAKLNEEQVQFANKHGYVETIPDSGVDPERGYPILCSRLEWGGIKPTVPLNYFVQGTACWAATRALVRCNDQLRVWREEDGFDGFITLYVHDELVFDLPYVADQGNLPRVKRLQRIMEESGDFIGVPLKVSVKYHPQTWSKSA